MYILQWQIKDLKRGRSNSNMHTGTGPVTIRIGELEECYYGVWGDDQPFLIVVLFETLFRVNEQ